MITALDRLDAGRKIGPVPDTSVTARLLDHARRVARSGSVPR
jgi:hypothetical protein